MQAQIEQVYQATKKALSDIYRKRRRTLFYQKIMWAATGIFFILMLLNIASSYFPDLQIPFLKQFSTSNSNPYGVMYPMIALVLLLYPTVYGFTKAFQTFKIKETETITKMVKQLFPKVDFAQNTSAPKNEIVQSKLFAWVKESTPIYNYGQIRSNVNDSVINITDIGILEENLNHNISGGLASIPILNMAVVLYEYVFKNVLTSKTADNVHYTFRGMFSWLIYPKKLNGHTVVLTNNQKQKIGRLVSFNFKEEQKVLLEDVRFANKFIVYSTDQVEARYVLSTALMERIVALEEKFKRNIFLSFQHRKMYLAVENTYGLFSFTSGKLEDIAIVEELANDINTALEISSNLKTG